MKKSNLKKKTSSGILLLGLRRVIIQIIFIFANIILARLLYPSDFGIYATSTFVFNFISVFCDIGFGPALIQKKEEVTLEDKQSVFTIQMILVLLASVCIYYLAPLVVKLWNLPLYTDKFITSFSLILIFLPFRSTSLAILERELEYKKIALIEVIEILFTAVSSIALAYLKFGVASLIYGLILGRVVGSLLSYCFKPFPLRFIIRFTALQKILRFGYSYQLNLIFGLFYGPLILLYLSKVVGQVNMGYYQFAQNLAVAPLVVPELFSRITFPTASRLRDNKIMLRTFVERAILINIVMSFPISLMLLFLGDKIVYFLYTGKWLPALPALYLGVFAYQVMSLTGIFSVLLFSFGKSKIVRNMSFVWAVLTWVLAPIFIKKYGFWGMSLAGFLVSLTGVWLIITVKRELTFSIKRNIIPPLISALLTSGLIYLLRFTITSLRTLILVGVIGGIFYFVLIVLILRKRLVKEILLPIVEAFD